MDAKHMLGASALAAAIGLTGLAGGGIATAGIAFGDTAPGFGGHAPPCRPDSADPGCAPAPPADFGPGHPGPPVYPGVPPGMPPGYIGGVPPGVPGVSPGMPR